jgi:dimethylhistidine N-methyltransferase
MATVSPRLEYIDGVSLNSREALIRQVQLGLARRPRSLPPWMFYDDRGSRLFDRITTLPEYYPTRTERAILTKNADEIVTSVLANNPRQLRIVELGAGIASKTEILLNAALGAQLDVVYVPLDVSQDALNITRGRIGHVFPGVRVEPRVVNYVIEPPHFDRFDGSTLLLYLGSSIGNFSPEDARRILRNGSSQMRDGDGLLLGVDLLKDETALLAAYDDAAGVTAAFNLNMLVRLNRELNADFDLNSFRHTVRWNAIASRIEMHLTCTHAQHVSIAAADLDIDLGQGESIHTENSYKFTDESIAMLVRDSGLEVGTIWKDSREKYALVFGHPVPDKA